MNFWPLGAILAGLLAYVALDTLALSSAVSWRYMFVLGGLVALVVLYFRRRIPAATIRRGARWTRSPRCARPRHRREHATRHPAR